MSPITTVLLGTSLLGGVAGVVGSFAVLRRRALVGDLLAHAALPGICLAFLVSGSRQFPALLLGALVTGLVGVTLVTVVCRWTRIKEDAAMGIVLSTFFGAGMALLSILPSLRPESSQAGLDRYLYGQAAGMIRQDLLLIAAVSAVVLTVIALLYKEFQLVSFDPAFASAQGWPALALDLAMMAALAAITVVGLPAVGVVLMAAMLITPAATARLWTHRLPVLLALAGITGAVSGATGTILSAGLLEEWLGFDPLAFGYNTRQLPTGPLVVLVGTGIFLVSLCLAPRRGILARLWSAVSLRRMVADENLLRTLYELSEPGLPDLPDLPLAELSARRAWGPLRQRRVLGRAERRGLVGLTSRGVRLTERGLIRAAELTRRHRLWELYLIQGANIAADHVDRDADSIEHQLPAEVVRQLEAELSAAGRLPWTAAVVPSSPHALLGPAPGSPP
jgi:manganese/zinc/iron transport system permease protein